MNCTNCGAPVGEGVKFCLSCGSPVTPPQAAPAPPGPYGPAPAHAPMSGQSAVLLIPAIFGIVGAIMLLVGDFGGWHNRGTYIEETVWIDAWSIAGVLIVPMAVLLFFVAIFSLQAYRSDPRVAHMLVLRGLIAALVVFIVTLVGGLILIAATWDNTSNWLDVGFFGGVFGGLISLIMLAYERKRLGQVLGGPMALHRPPQPYGQPAQPPQSAPYQQSPQPAPPAQPQCRNCRALLQPGVKFCHICGAPQS